MIKQKFSVKKPRKDSEIPLDQKPKKRDENRCSCGGRVFDEDNQLCYPCSLSDEPYEDEKVSKGL